MGLKRTTPYQIRFVSGWLVEKIRVLNMLK